MMTLAGLLVAAAKKSDSGIASVVKEVVQEGKDASLFKHAMKHGRVRKIN